MKQVQIPQLDHCPPGFGNTVGSQDEWNNAYKNWLKKRGFHEELRLMEIASKRGLNGRYSKRKKSQEEEFTDSERD